MYSLSESKAVAMPMIKNTDTMPELKRLVPLSAQEWDCLARFVMSVVDATMFYTPSWAKAARHRFLCEELDRIAAARATGP